MITAAYLLCLFRIIGNIPPNISKEEVHQSHEVLLSDQTHSQANRYLEKVTADKWFQYTCLLKIYLLQSIGTKIASWSSADTPEHNFGA